MEEKKIPRGPGGLPPEIVDIEWKGGNPKNGTGQYAWNEGPDAEKIGRYIEMAEEGNSAAMEMLCDIFIYGKRDFKVDYDISLKWSLAWIETGKARPAAWAIAGRCYDENLKDYETALKYFRAAVDAGDFKAIRYVAMLYWDGKIQVPEEGDETYADTAMKYMKQAASTNDRTAKSYVGQWYLSGRIPPEEGRSAESCALEYLIPAVEGSHGSEPGVQEAWECIKKCQGLS